MQKSSRPGRRLSWTGSFDPNSTTNIKWTVTYWDQHRNTLQACKNGTGKGNAPLSLEEPRDKKSNKGFITTAAAKDYEKIFACCQMWWTQRTLFILGHQSHLLWCQKKEAEYTSALIKCYHKLAQKFVIISVKSFKSTTSELFITGIIFNVLDTVILYIYKDDPHLKRKKDRKEVD